MTISVSRPHCIHYSGPRTLSMMELAQKHRFLSVHSQAQSSVPQASLTNACRPKRGRRRKRPELTDDQRRALRAAQNRQATRRSRERTRQKALELRTQLEASVREKQALQEERDHLLARMHSNDSQPSTLVESKQVANRTNNPMSIASLLNYDASSNSDEEKETLRTSDHCPTPCNDTTPVKKPRISLRTHHTSPVSTTSNTSSAQSYL